MSIYESFKNVIASLGMEELTHPIFYNSPIGIRFNIGDNGNEVYLDENEEGFTVNPEYLSVCLDRAKQIYCSLRNAPNVLVIDGYLCENDSVESFINTVITTTNLPHPQETKVEKNSEDGEEFNHIFLCWKLDGFNPDKLLQEIIMTDLGSGNHFLTSSVYFVCTNDNVIFHLYDDRGADLVTDKKEKIQHIYHKLNDLILDYDREKIDSIFKTKAE